MPLSLAPTSPPNPFPILPILMLLVRQKHCLTKSNSLVLASRSLASRSTVICHNVQVCRSAHFHTRAPRYIGNVISNDTAKSVAQALVRSLLDYANSFLFGVSKQNITKLQRAQNTLARVVTRSSRYDSDTIQLQKLHWLPIKQRIDFKIGILSFKTLTINSPAYLATLLNSYKPARTMRSTNNNLLQIPRTKTVTGTRALRCAAPQLWNSLPANITWFHSLDCFRQKLKSFLFRQAYGSSAI